MFVPNSPNEQQLSMFDSERYLSDREKRYLNQSWAKYFAEYIFPKIDEAPYAVLYSNKDSRPNTPVNVMVGALLLKELTGLSDSDLMMAMMFDIRYQYALHTTSYLEQPISDRTLGRFRERCNAYETATGIDLVKDTVQSLSEEMAQIMKIDCSLKRMDSLMVASNIKRMSRLELLYTCAANLAKEVRKNSGELPESLVHYTEKDDRNRVIYHSRSEEASSRIETVLADARTLRDFCGADYDESSNYQFLLRVLKEQAIENEDGSFRLRTKEDGGMDSSILQNPADPDATYREKAGKKNRGYVANVMESVGEGGSIITDYQYEQNTYSDSQFMQDAVNALGKQERPVTVVTDGAYAGKENQEQASKNNIEHISTNLTGRATDDIMADFEFSEDGTKVTKCPNGNMPKSCSYNKQTGQCNVSFHRSQCEACPYQKQCHPKMFKRTSRKTVSKTAKLRAEQQRYRETEEFSSMSRFRNGVEAIPSILRRKYHVDHMPVRGKLRTKMLFGLKIGALNISRFCRFMQDQDKCALSTGNV